MQEKDNFKNEPDLSQQIKEIYDRLTTISALYRKWHSSLTVKHIKEQFYDVFGEDMFKDLNQK